MAAVAGGLDHENADDAKGAEGKDGAAQPRVKELSVTLFGAVRQLGTFPTSVHTDIRHALEMLRRGKQPRLSRERLAAVDAALASEGSRFKSQAELRTEVEVWREESRRAFDAKAGALLCFVFTRR